MPFSSNTHTCIPSAPSLSAALRRADGGVAPGSSTAAAASSAVVTVKPTEQFLSCLSKSTSRTTRSDLVSRQVNLYIGPFLRKNLQTGPCQAKPYFSGLVGVCNGPQDDPAQRRPPTLELTLEDFREVYLSGYKFAPLPPLAGEAEHRIRIAIPTCMGAADIRVKAVPVARDTGSVKRGSAKRCLEAHSKNYYPLPFLCSAGPLMYCLINILELTAP